MMDSVVLVEAGAKEMAPVRHLGRTAHNMSSSSLRKKSDTSLLRKVPYPGLRAFLASLQEVLLGTKLFLLFPAVLLAVAARYLRFGQVPTSLPPSLSLSLLTWSVYELASIHSFISSVYICTVHT